MRSQRLLIPLTVLVAGATLALASSACSDGAGDRSLGTAPEAAGFDIPNNDGGTTITPPQPDLCTGIARTGEPVSELELPGDAPPAFGGDVLPGTYELSELDAYAPPGPRDPDAGEDEGPRARLTGRSAQITLVVSGKELRFVEARSSVHNGGLGPETVRAARYTVSGTTLVMTGVCPATAAPRSVPFSAVGGGLALFVDPAHREVYTRR